MEIIKRELGKIQSSKTVLIDGFPRTMENVLTWEIEMKTPICTLFLVSKTYVLNSHIREKLADQGRLTKGTPPRSTPYCTTNQFF